MPADSEKYAKTKTEINTLISKMGFEIGCRAHFANALGCGRSTLNNALNGARNGPRETELLNKLHKYLAGLYQYYRISAPVNTKPK